MDRKALILQSMTEANILPLTSRCNLHCVFCSHRQNPPGVEAVFLPDRPLAEVVESFACLDPCRKVVIGESATRIMEGEPFVHPDLLELLELFRDRFPKTPIQITTNGSYLTESVNARLKAVGNLTLVVSLNSATATGRLKLMGDRAPDTVLSGVRRLAAAGIPFHGSIVACPHLVGWDDLRQTVVFLAESGAQTVRLFLPGYTRLAPPALRFAASLYGELQQFVAELQQKLAVPLTLEPALVSDLSARVEGVIPFSPASRAGLLPGDIILQVDRNQVSSRFDAFERLRKAKSPAVMVRRGTAILNLALDKKKEESSGLVLVYDLDLDRLRAALRECRRRRAARVLLLCSTWGELILKKAFPLVADSEVDVEILPVPNRFFGGSIGSAGLLVVSDLEKALEEWQAGKTAAIPKKRETEPERQAERGLENIAGVPKLRNNNCREQLDSGFPDLILVPFQAFDRNGRDLLGRSVFDLETLMGCPVAFC